MGEGDRETGSGWDRGSIALGVCFVVVVVLALVRMLTAHEGMPYWGSDPFVFGGAVTGVTDGWGTVLGSGMVVLSGVVVWLARKGGGTGVLGGVAIALGMGAIGWHTATGDGAVTKTVSLGAFVGVLVAARCAVNTVPALRRLVLALMLGSVVVLLIEGAHQVFVQHPMTVAFFEESKAEFLASRGWHEGSFEALSYERRLRQPELSGWFGLSNVFAGVVGAMSLGLGMVAISGRKKWARLVSLLCVIAGGAALAMSGSKGAIGAVVLGVVVVALVTRTKLGARFCAGRVTIGACAAMIGGTVAGGVMGQLSLLFRAQYLVGALRIAKEHLAVGVGAEGFQDAYMALKVGTSPEDVASAHDVVLDLIAMLGVGGLAMVALLGVWVWGTRAEKESGEDGARSIPVGIGVRVIVLAVLVAGAAMIRVGSGALDSGHLAMLGLGALGWIGVSVVLWRSMGERSAVLGGFGLMVVLVLHGLFDLGAVWVVSAPVWGLGIGLGLSCPGGKVGMIGSGLGALAMVGMGSIGVWRGVERIGVDARLIEFGARASAFAQLRDAAATRVDRGERDAIARGISELSGARIEQLDRDTVREAEARVRAGVSGALGDLADGTGDPVIRIAAIEQGLAALEMGVGSDAGVAALWDRLGAHAEALDSEGAGFSELRWAGRVWDVRARARGDRDGLERAKEIWERADGLNPHDPAHALRMMDLCVELGDGEEARRWAREAIDRSGRMSLDPLKGLVEGDLDRARGVLGG